MEQVELAPNEARLIRRLREDFRNGIVTIEMQDGMPKRVSMVEHYQGLSNVSMDGLKNILERSAYGEITIIMRAGSPWRLVRRLEFADSSDGL